MKKKSSVLNFVYSMGILLGINSENKPLLKHQIYLFLPIFTMISIRIPEDVCFPPRGGDCDDGKSKWKGELCF